MSKVLIVAHKDCIDGLAAAWCVKTYCTLKDIRYEVLFVQYKEEDQIFVAVENDPTITKVIFGDFSLNASAIEELKYLMLSTRDIPETVIIEVYDHHKFAMEELNKLNVDDGRVKIVADVTKSGALICFDSFIRDMNETEYSNIGVETLMTFISDRDLWEWKLNNSKEVNEYLRTAIKMNDIESFDLVVATLLDNHVNILEETRNNVDYKVYTFDGVIETGKMLLIKTENQVNSKVNKAVLTRVNGRYFYIINATENISELGNAICLKYSTPALIYFITEDNKVVCSMRSIDNLAPVDSFAREFNGGGHPNAAGFVITLDQLKVMLEDELMSDAEFNL